MVSQQALACQKAQHRFHRLPGAGLIHPAVAVGIEGKRLGFPNLPVIVRRGGIERPRSMEYHIGQAELTCQFRVLIAGFHHAHMGHKRARHIEGRKLHPQRKILNSFKDPGSDALGGLPQAVPREHAVDVGIVDGPEPLLHIHGVGIDTGDHHDLFSGRQAALLLHLAQPFYQLGADVKLLVLIAPHTARRRPGRGRPGPQSVSGCVRRQRNGKVCNYGGP